MLDVSVLPLLQIEDARDEEISGLIGPGRVVALGESFHHSHELLEMRARLVRALVGSGGVRRILLEAVRPGPEPISDYIDGGRSDGEQVLGEAGARMWQNCETLRLLDWLRAFNVEHPHDPVTIKGIDILAPGPSMRALTPLVGTDQTEKLIAISHGFDVDGRADQMSYNRLPEAERVWLHRICAKLAIRMRSGDEDVCGIANIAQLRQHLRIVQRSLEMLEAGAGGWINGFAHRDRALAENVEEAVLGSEGRTLILSHNMHVNASPWHQPKGPHQITPMGGILRQRLGDDYVVIGTTFGSASFDRPIYGISRLSSEGTETIDEALSRRARATSMVDLRPLGRIDEMAMMGLDLHGAPNLTYPRFSDAFDLLLHVPIIHNAQALFATHLDLDISAVDQSRSAGSDHGVQSNA